MNIDDLTMGQVKEIQKLIMEPQTSPFKVGQKWLFRTVTHIDTGEITEINGDFLTLKNAAWIADTGRYSNALKSCNFNEVEPYPNGCVVNIGSVVDATPIETLPAEQK